MKLCIIGTGYVGLVSGACFAKLGNEVICVDKDDAKINMLNNNQVPFYEPSLETIISDAQQNNKIIFTTNIQKGIQDADIIFICVGTPSLPSGEADLTLVYQVAKDIAKYINNYKIIINKSTVPVGTGQNVKNIINENMHSKIEFDIASVPEFLREGSAVKDTLNPDRTVIGANSEKAISILQQLHRPFNAPILITNLETAEMIKYASNAFLATKISFINGIASICDKVGADVTKVAEGMGLDARIGPKFLQSGIGFGGACFPKDIKALIQISEKVGEKFTLLDEVLTINTKQRQRVIDLLNKKIDSLAGKTIGILGLSFKPNTDDLREAPSLDIIRNVVKQGGQVKCYDPIAMENAKKILNSNVTFASNMLEVAEKAHALVLVTEWDQFKIQDMKELKKLMSGKVFIDGRNIYDPDLMKKIGFDYVGIGRS